jgi:hypothetical protein
MVYLSLDTPRYAYCKAIAKMYEIAGLSHQFNGRSGQLMAQQGI